MTNETMFNAHRFFQANRRDRDRKHDAGGTIGGPVYIPKIYNGKNKTFFFFGLEEFHNKTITFGQRGTVPTAAFRNGDFSAALTGRQIGTDPQRRADPGERALRPAHRHHHQRPDLAHGVPGQHHPEERCWIRWRSRSRTCFPAPTNAELINNYIYDQPNPRDQVLPSLKLDHNIGSNTKLSFYWSYQSTHDIAGNDPLDYPITAKRDKTATGNTYRFNVDRTITPTFWYTHSASASCGSTIPTARRPAA